MILKVLSLLNDYDIKEKEPCIKYSSTLLSFLQKARTVATPKDIRLWRKDFCPSGSRCFDEYLDYFKNCSTVTVRRFQPASLSFASPGACPVPGEALVRGVPVCPKIKA